MAQRQFRNDDTDRWLDRYGSGSDGALTISGNTTDATANTTCSGTAGSTTLTVGSGTGFTNGNLVFIHQSRDTGAGVWELNKISSGGGTTSWTMAYNLMNTYSTSAQVYLLKQYSSVTINAGQTLTGQSWSGSQGGILAILCNGSITVNGTLSEAGASATSSSAGATGGGYRGGGGMANVNNPAGYGEGTAGPPSNGSGAGSGNFSAANGNGGGGVNHVGSNIVSAGGGGGNGTTGGAGAGLSGSGGQGGGTAGVANLTTMVFGGGGGGCSTDANAPGGAAGGGIILLIGKTITVTGGINLNGGNSFTSTHTGYTNDPPSSGSGAGGSCLLKGQTITLGTNLITATGGPQGGGNTPGGAGGVGRIHADYSGSISGTTNPTIDTAQQSVLADQSGALFFAQY